MKKSIFIILLFFGIVFQCYSQGKYKIKFTICKGEFIIPPKSHWGYKKNGEKKRGHDQYYYVMFYGLSKDYLKSISELYFTDYWSGNTDYFEENKMPKHKKSLLNRKIKQQGSKLIELKDFESTVDSLPFKCSPLDTNNSVYFIQIDYDALLKGIKPQQIDSNFFQLAKALLIEISGKEDGYGWPKSISQNLVEKLFELIPIPQEASLARYSFIKNDRYSFVLLNPKILMMVDVTERVRTRWDGGIDLKYWQMNYYGQIPIRFFRGEKGKIIQTPFLNFSNKQLPSNSSSNPKIQNSTLQASSADIQLTSGLKDRNFLGLFQHDLK